MRIGYVGLDSVERHMARVTLPCGTGRTRYSGKNWRRNTQSRLNLIRLLPRLTELLLFDNSFEADPYTGTIPETEASPSSGSGRGA